MYAGGGRLLTKFKICAALFTGMALLLTQNMSFATPLPKNMYLQVPFDAYVEQLPKAFLGHQPMTVYQVLATNVVAPKGEFESSADYAQRATRSLQKPLFGTVNRTTLLAFSFSPDLFKDQVTFRYDADLRVMNLQMDVPTGSVLPFETQHRLEGTYTASNAFGVKTQVSKSTLTYYGLRFDRPQAARFPIALSAAQRVKKDARILLIGRLVPPYVSTSSRYMEPTITSPIELTVTTHAIEFQVEDLWVFDSMTGKILFQPSAGDDILGASQVDDNGNTALHLAIWREEYLKAERMIAAVRTDLNAKNKFGATALHMAVWKKHRRLVEVLIKAGADRSSLDANSHTPYDDALAAGQTDIAELLRK